MDPHFYVFYVNEGHCIPIKVNSLRTSIARIRHEIALETDLRPEDQILLSSAGIQLDPEATVESMRRTGSRQHPAFLFQRGYRSKSSLSSSTETISWIHALDNTMRDALNLLTSSDNGHKYIEVPKTAKYCGELIAKSVHISARLVQEHQFLHQAWVALISNLDELVQRLHKRTKKYQHQLERLPELSSKALTIVENFDHVLEQLSLIEIAPEIERHIRRPSTHTGRLTLYDWIAYADNDHSLEDLAKDVREQFANLSATNTKNVTPIIESVLTQSKSSEFRDIRGFNTRLTQLENKLASAEKLKKEVDECVERINAKTNVQDAATLKRTIEEYEGRMQPILNTLKDFRETVKIFSNSKQELLSNILNRLSSFIAQCYDKLHRVNTEIVIFDEKSTALRMRLTLIEQIRDAPATYARSVAEVIRRLEFKKELTLWHSEHSEKCSELISTEEDLRKRFKNKLENHFLKSLFSGMFDNVPPFFVKEITPFDDRMPDVSNEHIKFLRKALPDLDEFLRVTTPQIFSKLFIKDPAAQVAHTAHMRREESFFTQDPIQMNNLSSVHKDFTPAQWYGEDVVDGSPANPIPILMPKNPQIVGSMSTGAIPIVPSLDQLDMLDKESGSYTPCASVGKSAPIDIPTAGTSRFGDQSNVSSLKYATPDDNFESSRMAEAQFDSDEDLKQSFEHLLPMKNELLLLRKNLADIRADFVNNRDKYDDEFKQVSTFLTATLPSEIEKLNNDHEATIVEHVNKIKELQEKVEEAEQRAARAESSIEEAREMAETEKKDHDDLVAMLNKKLDETTEEIEVQKNEVFKRLTIEYELMNDRMRSENDKSLEEKDMTIDDLKKELEKKNAEIRKLKMDASSEEYREELSAQIRQELEKEFKIKIDRLSEAVEAKKEDAVARAKKEHEVERRMLMEDVKQYLSKVMGERDTLRGTLQAFPDTESIMKGLSTSDTVPASLKEIVADIRSSSSEEVNMAVSRVTENLGNQALMTKSTMVGPQKQNSMDASCMIMSTMPLASPTERDVGVVRAFEDKDAEGNTKAFSCYTQTQLKMEFMDKFLHIHEIKELAVVLAIWDKSHNAFVVFCSSSYMYFLKETSVRRMRLMGEEDATPKRYWAIGKVKKIDMCIIKKSTNRYGLPTNTKVFRVELDHVQFDGIPSAFEFLNNSA